MLRPYTRYMIKHYLWFVMVVFLAILSVVTTINVATEIREVWRRAQQAAVSSPWELVGEYVYLRVLDNGSQVFAVALVLGIVWGEFSHHSSGRHTMVRATGLSFFKSIKVVALVAALALPVQLILDNWVRPYAFMTLSKKHLGEYGWEYQRIRSGRTYWLSFDNDVMQARIEDKPDPVIREVTLYRFNEVGELSLILTADELVQEHPGSNWMAKRGKIWPVSTERNSNTGKRVTAQTVDLSNPFDLGYSVNQLWLEYRDIHPKYIPTKNLLELAGGNAGLPDQHPNYRSWVHIRITQALNAALLAVCLVAVFDLLGGRFGVYVAASAMVIVGYLGFVSTRVTAVFAEHSAELSLLMTWAFPTCLLLAAFALLFAINHRDKRPLR